MRERKGLGAPVPEGASDPAPSDGRIRRAVVGESVPDDIAEGLSIVIGARSWRLAGTRLLVGRAGGEAGAHVEVDDSSVSRRHAELVVMGATWVLRDLASTNGTWVDDRKVLAGEALHITAGVALRFGSIYARVK